MPEENINQEFRLKKKKDEIRNYLIQEINQNKLMSKKHIKSCRVLNYTEVLLTVILSLTFASLVGIPIGITTTATGLKSKSIIKKKEEA